MRDNGFEFRICDLLSQSGCAVKRVQREQGNEDKSAKLRSHISDEILCVFHTAGSRLRCLVWGRSMTFRS
jgi:hypothetical protein